MGHSEQNSYPRGFFPVRIRIDRQGKNEHPALHLLEQFIETTRQRYEVAIVEAPRGDSTHAEAVVAVPFPEREHIRVDFNIFASEKEEELGQGYYFYMESAF